MSDDYRKGFADGYAKANAEFADLKVLYEKHLARLLEMQSELARLSRLYWDHSEQDDVKATRLQ
jgi:hypothetical protein